jgi:polar amino acid transport system substrate-binding protein
MRTSRLIAFALMALLGWFGPAVAASGAKLRLVSDPFPPFYGENLPDYGLAGEIMQVALTAEGYEVELSVAPWARAFQDAQQGVKDGLVCAWWSARWPI